METIFRLDILVDEENYDRVLGVLTLLVNFGWQESSLTTGQTRFRVHCENEGFLRELARELEIRLGGCAEWGIMTEEKEDWLAAWREYFTPVCCGKLFLVLPPWLVESQASHPDRFPILIEPKSAFGTGQHATTALCLSVLGELLSSGRLQPGQEFLDLGTGTGILGIGCCKAGMHGIGLDIDPLSIENARENRALNGVKDFEVAQGSIGDAPARAFDLVIANILARPLIEMAPSLAAAKKPDGCLVLCGLLAVQADNVEKAFREQGLPAARRVVEGEWCALVWS